MTELETRTGDEDEKPKKTKAKKSTKKKSTAKKGEAKAAAPVEVHEGNAGIEPPAEEADTNATETARGDHANGHLPGPGPANRRRKKV